MDMRYQTFLSITDSPGFPGYNGRFNHTGFRKDEDALTHIIEFTLALIILIIVIAGYFQAIEHKFIIQSPEDSRRDEVCIRLSERLLDDSGNAITGSGNTSQWERLDSMAIAENLTRPGLAAEGRDFGVISQEKLLGLRNVTYEKLLDILAMEDYYFNIEILELDDTRLIHFGLSSDGVKGVSEVKRIAILQNDTGERTVKVNIRVFEGVNKRTLVRVNEFMYHPEEGKHEWVELYNPSDEAVDLSTFAMYVNTRDQLRADNKILPGKSYGVISDSEAAWSEYAISPDALPFLVKDNALGLNGFSDIGMEFVIAGQWFRTQKYSYNSTLGGNGDGHSLEWSSASGGWVSSAGVGGTPGRVNSVA